MENERDIFISYHTDSSAEIVRKLSIALEGNGLTCWYAPRDCSDEYASSIVHAIKNSKILLLVLNDQSNVSKHCLNEINIAFNNGNPILPIRISEVTLSDDMYYYIGRIHIMDGGIPPELLKIQEIIDRCRQLLGKVKSFSTIVTNNITSKIEHYSLVSSLCYPDFRFVGRSKELEEIAHRLSGFDNKLFLFGMGGIGKSEIAKMYIKQYAEKYKAVLWVPFTDNLVHTISSDSAFPIEGINCTSCPSDSDEEYAVRKMDILKKIADKNVLIIVDNFDVEDDPYLDKFLSGTYSVLLTTRIHHDWKNEIAVLPMENESDLISLFSIEYKRQMDSDEKKAVKELIRYLDGHTLSIRLIASAMQKRRIKPNEMLRLLKEEDSSKINSDKKLSDQIFSRIRTVFNLSTLSEDELHLLMNLSLISNIGIDVTKFYEWCELSDYELIDNLIARSWIIHDTVQDMVHLHPIIAELMLQELNVHPEVCDTMLKNYYKEYKGRKQCSIKERSYNYELSKVIWERLPALSAHRDEALLIKIYNTRHLSLYEATLDDCKELIEYAADLEYKLYGYEICSHNHSLLGNNKESLIAAKNGERLLETINPAQLENYEDHQLTLLERISEASDHLGYSEAAYHSELKAYKISEKKYQTEKSAAATSTVGWGEFHLTHCLYHLGRYDEALEMTYRSIKHFEECGNKWGMSFSFWHLAILLARQGKYDEAESYIKQSLDNLIPLIGQDNVDIAKTLH